MKPSQGNVESPVLSFVNRNLQTLRWSVAEVRCEVTHWDHREMMPKSSYSSLALPCHQPWMLSQAVSRSQPEAFVGLLLARSIQKDFAALEFGPPLVLTTVTRRAEWKFCLQLKWMFFPQKAYLGEAGSLKRDLNPSQRCWWDLQICCWSTARQ